jgi:hypothetical protein
MVIHVGKNPGTIVKSLDTEANSFPLFPDFRSIKSANGEVRKFPGNFTQQDDLSNTGFAF